MSKKITTLVITGGPCSGKSTGMSYLVQKLQEFGYGVLIVPELATEVINSGAKPSSNIEVYDFEETLLVGQMEREVFYSRLAKHMQYEKIVILCDRGVMDVKSYMQPNEWTSLLQDLSLHEIALRDKLYDAVIHLRTAALGAEAFYTKANNTARIENIHEARVACERTLQAWLGHPHLHVIDNSTDFEMKMRRVLKAVLHILGEPIPLEIEKKYLVDPHFSLEQIPCQATTTNIEQAYLPGGFRIRRRGDNGIYIHTKTYKEATTDPRVRIESEELISARTYEVLLQEKLPHIPLLQKTRTCFVYEEQYFELDIFKQVKTKDGKQLLLLEIELTEAHSEVKIPPWLPVMREVTNEAEFRNISIATSATL